MIYLHIFISVASLAPVKSYDYLGVREIALKDMGKWTRTTLQWNTRRREECAWFLRCIDGFVQDCSIFSALAMEIPPSSLSHLDIYSIPYVRMNNLISPPPYVVLFIPIVVDTYYHVLWRNWVLDLPFILMQFPLWIMKRVWNIDFRWCATKRKRKYLWGNNKEIDSLLYYGGDINTFNMETQL